MGFKAKPQPQVHLHAFQALKFAFCSNVFYTIFNNNSAYRCCVFHTATFTIKLYFVTVTILNVFVIVIVFFVIFDIFDIYK